MNLQILFLFLAATVHEIAGSCKPGSNVTSIRYSDAIVNHTIVGPVLSNITAKNERECEIECHLAAPLDMCYMFNYHPSTKVCELLYKDRAAEYSVEKKKGSTFKTKTCPSNPCLPGYACFNLGDQSNNSCIFVKEIDECASSPCMNKGTCRDKAFSYNCTCAAGFTGVHCEAGGVWTQWTSWSACPSLPDCPRTRTRNCTNAAVPNNTGNCSGSAVDSDNTTCQIQAVNTTGCEKPLGMEDRSILNSQITASSFFGLREGQGPHLARLNNQPTSVSSGAWAAGVLSAGEYLQVDLGKVKKVTKVATQGRKSNEYNQFVIEYSVSYSNDTRDWSDYQGDCIKKFPGNFNKDKAVTNNFEIPIIARYIRVIVQKWNEGPSMRIELYGCTPP